MATTNTNSKVIRFGKFRYLAAGGILVLILTMCFLPVGGGNLFTALEDRLSETLEIFSVRGAEGTQAAVEELKNCMKLYNEKNYAEAVPAFENYVNEFPGSDNIDKAKLYLSVSYIYNNQAEEANPILKDLSTNESFEMQEDVQWFLGFSYVFLRDLDQAKNSFALLTESETYGERAEAMLEANAGTQADNVVFK